MNIQEFSDQFDVLYSNITSNQAAGLNEYEKSVFLTKAEKEIVKDYFSANSMGNTLKQGYDDSAKRQADFSMLMKTAICTPCTISGGTITVYSYKYTPSGSSAVYPDPGTIYFLATTSTGTMPIVVPASATPYSVSAQGVITVNGRPVTVYINGTKLGAGSLEVTGTSVGLTSRIDKRSHVYSFPSDVFISINESVEMDSNTESIKQVIPLRFDEYMRLMSKPYKRPLKHQVWRLINTGNSSNSTRIVELVFGPEVGADDNIPYNIRYIRTPKPIIVSYLDGLTIDGLEGPSTECELDPILHEDVLQRAVELAKVAWTANGQENVQLVMEAGKRSE